MIFILLAHFRHMKELDEAVARHEAVASLEVKAMSAFRLGSADEESQDSSEWWKNGGSPPSDIDV